MKKIFVVAVALVCLAVVMGTAGFRSIPSLLTSNNQKKICRGYTIISFDQGVDCHGDTIRLVRKNGFAQREW